LGEGLEAAMSSDFSIKPVGTPVAAPMPPPAADEAVAAELPAHQSVAAADTSPRLRHDTESASDNLSHHVILDRDAASIVYQVVDKRTSLVVRRYPDQAVLRRRAYFRALEQAREDAQALRIDRKI
jgi:hypothetical protein